MARAGILKAKIGLIALGCALVATAAVADESAPSNSVAAAPSAFAALDAISADDWLHQPSRVLLGRVIKASSKEALDESAKTDPRAQTLVGAGFHFGLNGYPKEIAQAVAFYQKGAAAGNPIAQVNLGALLNDGTASTDGQRAIGPAADYFRKAAEQGHPVGAFNLGMLYRDGDIRPLDYTQAARWLKVAADAGIAKAQFELGEMYYGGRGSHGEYVPMGVQINDEEADRLVKLAASQGFADALDALALSDQMEIYGTGDFDTNSPLFKQAFDAYARDAAQGDAHAQFMLGEYYQMGNGVAKDPAKAYASYKRAADQGVADAWNAVGEMTEKGEVVAKDEAAAAAIFKALATQGHAEAEYNLARMTAAGLGGVPQDRHEAMRLYKLAAQHGSGFAQQYLQKLGISW